MLTRIQIRTIAETSHEAADELRATMEAIEEALDIQLNDGGEMVIEGSPGRNFNGRLTVGVKTQTKVPVTP